MVHFGCCLREQLEWDVLDTMLAIHLQPGETLQSYHSRMKTAVANLVATFPALYSASTLANDLAAVTLLNTP